MIDQKSPEILFPKIQNEELVSAKHPVYQKLLVIYSDGMAADFVMKKNLEIKITRSHKFPFDKCGFHAFHENGYFQTLVGDHKKLNVFYTPEFNFKLIQGQHFKFWIPGLYKALVGSTGLLKIVYIVLGSKLPISKKYRSIENFLKPGKNQDSSFNDIPDGDGFSVGSNGVRIGNFYWMIGGHHYCQSLQAIMSNEAISAFDSRNKNSFLWSISKRKWIKGIMSEFSVNLNTLTHH